MLGLQRTNGNRFVARLVEQTRRVGIHHRARAARVESEHDHTVRELRSDGASGNQTPLPAIQRQATKGSGQPKGVTTFEQVSSTYGVEASTLEEAAQVLEARAEAGETTWEPKLEFKLNGSGRVTSATVHVTITVTMPDWPGAANLTGPARAEWDRAYRALKAHEDQHVSLVRAKLDGLANRMIGKTEAQANKLFEDALAGLQTASDKFDEATDHGRNSGTVIDTSAGESANTE